MKAGPEIGVASTKAFTTQLLSLLLVTLMFGRHRGITAAREAEFVPHLYHAAAAVEQALEMNDLVRLLAEDFAEKHHALFLGRGALSAIADHAIVRSPPVGSPSCPFFRHASRLAERWRLTARTDEPIAKRAVSSAVEHYLDMVGVTGSIPVLPTTFSTKSRDTLKRLSDAVFFVRRTRGTLPQPCGLLSLV